MCEAKVVSLMCSDSLMNSFIHSMGGGGLQQPVQMRRYIMAEFRSPVEYQAFASCTDGHLPDCASAAQTRPRDVSDG